jgi:hypothetical protein
MGARIVTGFGRWFPPISGQGAGCLCTLFLATLLPGCASVSVLMLSSESFTRQGRPVEVLDRPFTGRHGGTERSIAIIVRRYSAGHARCYASFHAGAHVRY